MIAVIEDPFVVQYTSRTPHEKMKKAFYARRAWHAFFNLFLALMWTLGETMDSVRWIHGLNTQAPWCLSLFWCLVSVSSAQGSQGNGQLLCECWTVKSPVRSLWLHDWIEKMWFDIWYLCAIFVILDVHIHSHPAASRVYWTSHWCMECVMSSDSSDDFTSQNGKLYSVRTLASKPRSFVRDFVTNHYQLNDDFGGFLRGKRWLEWIRCFCSSTCGMILWPQTSPWPNKPQVCRGSLENTARMVRRKRKLFRTLSRPTRIGPGFYGPAIKRGWKWNCNGHAGPFWILLVVALCCLLCAVCCVLYCVFFHVLFVVSFSSSVFSVFSPQFSLFPHLSGEGC